MPEEVVILSTGPTAVETQLNHELQAQGYKPIVVPWTDATAASSVRERRCISLVELEEPLFKDLSEKDFSRLGNVVKNALHITWVV